MTKKFWMMVVAILALGAMTTGCPDGDDSCSSGSCDVCGNEYCGEAEYASGSCPADCGYGYCGDGICEELGAGRETCATCPSDCRTGCSSDADADSDAETDTAGDDGDTSEVASCPDVSGDWALTYRNTETGAEDHLLLTLEQDGCLVIGVDDNCEYSGSVLATGYISLYRDCYTTDRTVSGTFTDPPHMRGDWETITEPIVRGTWEAVPPSP